MQQGCCLVHLGMLFRGGPQSYGGHIYGSVFHRENADKP